MTRTRPRRRLLMLLAAVTTAALVCVCVVVGVRLLTRPPGDSHPTSTGITGAPTRIAHTSRGMVGYRELGDGPPLLLITGYGATMNDWAPSFVDALAARFRVILVDNAGVGETAAPHPPLSVSTMADQTSALISALDLHGCDVLGWSMGGMIAQDLAIAHPNQVHRLVLAATQPGTGTATPVPATARKALDSGDPVATIGLLFPVGQSAAARSYAAGILSYPHHYAVSATVRRAQQAAADRWFAGDDPVGRNPNEIQAPTLVADGTEDALDPVGNDHLLASLIPGSRLVLYSGAGHGFLFQDTAEVVHELTLFLE